MSAHIDVVETAATDPHDLLDGVVVAALSARRVLAVLGAVLIGFSLGASLAVDSNLRTLENPWNASVVPARSSGPPLPPSGRRIR
jgi:hypothetical protein